MGDTFNHLISKGWRLMGLWSCGDRASDLHQIHRSCPLQPRARNSLDELQTCYPSSRSNLLPIHRSVHPQSGRVEGREEDKMRRPEVPSGVWLELKVA